MRSNKNILILNQFETLNLSELSKKREVEIRAVKISIDGSSIRIRGRKKEFNFDLSEIRNFGVERRFNRILALLLLAMAIISIITLNMIYLILTFIMLIIAIVSREEILLLELEEDIIKVRDLKKRDLNKTLEFLRKHSTH